MTTDEARRERELRAQEQRAALIEQGDRIDERLHGIEARMDERRDRELAADEERRKQATERRRRQRRRDLIGAAVAVAVLVAAIAVSTWQVSSKAACLRSWANAQQARAEAVTAASQAERRATLARDEAQADRDAVLARAQANPPKTDAEREVVAREFIAKQATLSRANTALNSAHAAYDDTQKRLSLQDVGAKLNC